MPVRCNFSILRYAHYIIKLLMRKAIPVPNHLINLERRCFMLWNPHQNYVCAVDR